jgi:hypothetical protein
MAVDQRKIWIASLSRSGALSIIVTSVGSINTSSGPMDDEHLDLIVLGSPRLVVGDPC